MQKLNNVERIKRAKVLAQVLKDAGKKKGYTDMRGRSDLVDVTGTLREDRALSYMIFFGDYTPSGTASTKREVWVSLPKSLTEFDGEDTFTIPRWLCEEKGLDNHVD